MPRRVKIHRYGMPLNMTKNDDIAKALNARLSELTGRVAEIDSELRKPLSADSEDRAIDLENQDASDSSGAEADCRRHLWRLRQVRRGYQP